MYNTVGVDHGYEVEVEPSEQIEGELVFWYESSDHLFADERTNSFAGVLTGGDQDSAFGWFIFLGYADAGNIVAQLWLSCNLKSEGYFSEMRLLYFSDELHEFRKGVGWSRAEVYWLSLLEIILK
jgi:hypothetical protein